MVKPETNHTDWAIFQKASTKEPCRWMNVRGEPREFFFKWLFWSGGMLIQSVNLSCNVNLRLRFTCVNLEGQRPASQKKVPANLWDPDSLKLSAFAKESWLDAPHYHQQSTLCHIPIGLFFSHFVLCHKEKPELLVNTWDFKLKKNIYRSWGILVGVLMKGGLLMESCIAKFALLLHLWPNPFHSPSVWIAHPFKNIAPD